MSRIRGTDWVLVLVAAAGLLLSAACSDGKDSPPSPAAVSSSSTPPVSSSTPAADPYEVYLANAPKGEPTLSREDASTRALLGCGRKWPPGSVDAVLADAYAAYCTPSSSAGNALMSRRMPDRCAFAPGHGRGRGHKPVCRPTFPLPPVHYVGQVV